MGLITHPMEYLRARSLQEAATMLATHGDVARVIAGGQSLLPLMKLQLAQPSVLIDISGIPGLDGIEAQGGAVQVGALVRHATLESDAMIRSGLPLLAEMAKVVGDPQIRSLGTLGGVIAHADPAGDYCMLAVLLDAIVVTTKREVGARDFFKSSYTTALAQDEVVSAVRFPRAVEAHAYVKIIKLPYNSGVPGVAVQRVGGTWRIGLTNMGGTPARATEVESQLARGARPAEAVEGAFEDVDLGASDMPTDYRREMARVLTRRALERAGA